MSKTGRDFYFERLITRTAAARARETFCEPVNCGVLLANVLAQLFNGFGALIVAVRQGYHLRARRIRAPGRPTRAEGHQRKRRAVDHDP